MAQMKVSTLLGEYKKWVDADDIQFLQEPKQQEEVTTCIGELSPIMKRLERREKNGGTQGEGQDWYKAHEKGRELWKMLAKYALRGIEPTSRGNATLYRFLEAATEFEDVLYGLEPYYRDHTLHSLWVYLIGERILREPIKDGASDKCIYLREKLNWYLYNDISEDAAKYKYPDVLVNYSETKARILTKVVNRYRDATWCIMALCHDLGYSLDKLNKLNDKVKAVLDFFDISDLEHTGYSLDIEHQYLVSQCLELMAMDVRIVPDEDLSEVKEMEEMTKDNINKILERMESEQSKKKLEEYLKEYMSELGTGKPTKLDTMKFMQAAADLDDTTDEGKKVLEDIRKLDERTLVKCYRDDSTYWRLCRALEKKQHGILSSYLIYKILGIFADATVRGPAEVWGLDDDEVVENIIRGDILFAIAQHEFDFTHIFEFGSLADTLILADELEEFSRFGRPLLSREYHPTTATADVELISEVKDITIKIIYDVKKDHNLISFFISKAERLCRIYSLSERDETTGTYRIKQIIMTAKKVKTNKTLELRIELSKGQDNSKVQLPQYESSGTASNGDMQDYPIRLYDDRICIVLKKDEMTLRELFFKRKLLWGLGKEWRDEIGKYKKDFPESLEEKT